MLLVPVFTIILKSLRIDFAVSLPHAIIAIEILLDPLLITDDGYSGTDLPLMVTDKPAL